MNFIAYFILLQCMLHFVLNLDFDDSKPHFYTINELLCGMTSAADVTKENKTWESFLEVFETNQGWGHLKMAFVFELNLHLHLQIFMKLKMRENLSRKCKCKISGAILKKWKMQMRVQSMGFRQAN